MSVVVSGGKFHSYISMEIMAKCLGCKGMLRSMVSRTMHRSTNWRGEIKNLLRHGGKNHFNSELFSLMEKFVKLTGKRVTFD